MLMTGSFLLGHDNTTVTGGKWFYGEWWYNTTALFLLGILVAKIRVRCMTVIKRWYYVILLTCLTGFCVFYPLTSYLLEHVGYWTEYNISSNQMNMQYGDKLITFFSQVLMVIFFVCLVILILQKLRLHNKILVFLGRISLEMILINKVFILIFWNVKLKYGLNSFLILVLLSTIVAAVALNEIKRRVLERK